MTADARAAPDPVAPRIEHYPARSRRARLLGPLLRLCVRPILDIVPLTPWILARLHLIDLLGAALRLPAGAGAQRRSFGDFDAELVVGAGVSPADSLVLYFHGGGFVACGLRSHRRLAAQISSAAGVRVLHVNYRQLPTAVLAQTVEDCLLVYRELLTGGHRGDRIVLAGDSAGGYLAFAVARQALDEGLSRPAGIVALSPWVDLIGQHNLGHSNARADSYIPAKLLVRIGALLAGDGDPLVPLLEADLSGLPPTLIQVGSTEVLRSDAELMTEQLARSGVGCVLQIWDRQIHVFQAAADVLPEGRAAIKEIGAFARACLAPQVVSARDVVDTSESNPLTADPPSTNSTTR